MLAKQAFHLCNGSKLRNLQKYINLCIRFRQLNKVPKLTATSLRLATSWPAYGRKTGNCKIIKVTFKSFCLKKVTFYLVLSGYVAILAFLIFIIFTCLILVSHCLLQHCTTHLEAIKKFHIRI